MDFRITGLDGARFAHLFGLDDEALAHHNACRRVADSHPGYPDRIALDDAAPGERLLLVNHLHHDVANPYRASHAVYVREGGAERFDAIGRVPPSLRSRLLSLRAFDAAGMLQTADVVDGRELEALIERLFAEPGVAYLHAHYARPGCYAARIDRA